MLPHLKHLLYPKMIVSFTNWCLFVEWPSQGLLSPFHEAALTGSSGVRGRDTAFNQQSALLSLCCVALMR